MIEHDIVFRIKTEHIPGTLANALLNVAQFGAHIGDIETTLMAHGYNIREVTVVAPSAKTRY